MMIQNKFETITIDSQIYVKVSLINEVYKNITGKSGSTQKKIVDELQLNKHAAVWRRNKDKNKIGTVASRFLDQFKSQSQDIYVDIREVMTPKKGRNIDAHIELLKRISELPDLNTDLDSDSDEVDEPTVQASAAPITINTESDLDSDSNEVDEPTVQASAAPITINTESDSDSDSNEVDDPTVQASAAPITINTDRVLMPIIELEEHEMFQDANDQVFSIEVRGERSKDKILFKAKDVATFAENDRLIRTLLDDRKSYQYEKDYQILENDGVRQWRTLNSSENLIATVLPLNSSVNGRVNWNNVYLTLAGLIRVVNISRNANANLLKLFDWLQNLFYVHQFGSREERNELARSLFKQVLNDKLAGLYCIDLGTFNDLYDTMNISRETYPPKIYGNYRVCKFGLSENISTRLTQHKNKKTGYGQWSSDVQFKWLILLSPSQLPKAEKILSNLLKADGYTFDHSDTSKNHTELIMFDPLKEHKIKQIYRQVLDLYPSKENELSKALEDAQSSFETKINLIQAQHKIETNDLKATIKINELTYANEMLQMQLKMAQMGIN